MGPLGRTKLELPQRPPTCDWKSAMAFRVHSHVYKLRLRHQPWHKDNEYFLLVVEEPWQVSTAPFGEVLERYASQMLAMGILTPSSKGSLSVPQLAPDLRADLDTHSVGNHDFPLKGPTLSFCLWDFNFHLLLNWATHKETVYLPLLGRPPLISDSQQWPWRSSDFATDIGDNIHITTEE